VFGKMMARLMSLRCPWLESWVTSLVFKSSN
jgi:hypothetical protein